MRTLFFVSMILTSLSVSAQEKEKDTLSNWTKEESSLYYSTKHHFLTGLLVERIRFRGR